MVENELNMRSKVRSIQGVLSSTSERAETGENKSNQDCAEIK